MSFQVQNVIQIKWADGEEQRLGLAGIVDPNMATKLFVGSIPKEATEVIFEIPMMMMMMIDVLS